MPLYASFLRDNVADLALKASMAADSEAKNHREVSEVQSSPAPFTILPYYYACNVTVGL